MKDRCKIDDCDQSHCSRCGCHTLGRLEHGQVCQGCEDELATVEPRDKDGLTATGRLHKTMEETGSDL